MHDSLYLSVLLAGSVAFSALPASAAEPGTTVNVNVNPIAAPPPPPPKPAPPPVYVPPPCPTPAPKPPPPKPKKVGRTEIVAGATIFGTMYGFSSLAGVIAADFGATQWGRRMTIPIVGPFLAAPTNDSYTAGWFTAMLGIAQAAGAITLVAGLAKRGRHRRQGRLAATSSGVAVRF